MEAGLALFVVLHCAGLLMADACVDFSNMTRRQVLHWLLVDSNNDPSIPPDYDKDVPTNVTVQLHIVSFHSVSEMSMDFSITFYLRQKWVDERLAFPTFRGSEVLELDTHLKDRLWVPDIFFRNEKTAMLHNVTVPNHLIHLHRNGTVMYSSRMSMTLSCPMDLILFPLDTQVCPIIIQSYAYSTSNVMFRWQEDSSVSKSDNWIMGHFMDNDIDTDGCSHIFDYHFACVMATVRLQRHLGYFVMHVYLPTVLVVVMSWLSFWIDAGATKARITIGVMSVLTMATQSSSVQNVLPRVSYVKAIDVWMAVCVIFVFAALLEYSYVNVLTRRKAVVLNAVQLLRKEAPTESRVTEVKGVAVDTSQALTWPGIEPRRVDKLSRWVFPTLFVLFILVYWTAYGVLSSRQASRRAVL